ncbi:MAG: glycosyltransferase family 2 protein [Pyrinomonadaceae bacterium]
MDHKVSIVIIGRNEEQSIGKCIDAALAASARVGGAEVIYVDSNSTDGTVAVVRQHGVSIRLLDPNLRACPSAGRFTGSLAAAGEYILFLDADTLIYPDFLPQAIKHFEGDGSIGGVNGRIDDLTESGAAVPEIDERSNGTMDVKWLRGPSCLYRRTALLKAGSFNPELAMEEEAELGLRIVARGWKLNVLPIPMSCHTRAFHPNSLRSTWATFRRDIRSKRIGEITRTIAYAFRAGNGIEFCWLRLKTTIVFAIWLAMIAACSLLPSSVYPHYFAFMLFLLGVAAVFAKKRSLPQIVTFAAAKTINLIDVIAGIPLIFRSREGANTDGKRAGLIANEN